MFLIRQGILPVVPSPISRVFVNSSLLITVTCFCLDQKQRVEAGKGNLSFLVHSTCFLIFAIFDHYKQHLVLFDYPAPLPLTERSANRKKNPNIWSALCFQQPPYINGTEAKSKHILVSGEHMFFTFRASSALTVSPSPQGSSFPLSWHPLV